VPAQDLITSASNPRFRQWKEHVRHPEEAPWLPIEGVRQVLEISATRRIRLLLLDEEAERGPATAAIARSDEVVRLPRRLMESLSTVRASQGVVACFDPPAWKWSDASPFVVVLDGIQDPGNLGTVLRSAAAFGFSLVTSPGTVSCRNGKVVRASAGYLFRVPFLEGVDLAELKSRGYRLCWADAHGSTEAANLEAVPPLALVIGREGGAAPPPGALTVRIPMSTGVDSLNAGVAASLLMYEVFRRRP
jgi:TrmH family RNA methyltransferase